jgi:hypothetical protein
MHRPAVFICKPDNDRFRVEQVIVQMMEEPR